jgi:3-methyladenine DNA glycosylase/8-oxoguanine DNA glycosylase
MLASPTAPDAQLNLALEAPLDLRLTLGPLRRGNGDPSMRLETTGAVSCTMNTRSGGATLRLSQRATTVLAQAWGPGSDEALASVADLIGLRDEPQRLVAHHPVIGELVHRFPGLRLPRTNRLFDALVPAILEQKVTNTEAWRGYRGLMRTVAEPAPGPLDMLLPATPDAVASLPYFALHRFGVERRRAEVLRHAASEAIRLEGASSAVAYPRLRAIPGIGPWTIAEVGRLTYGDPDAVSVGDYHVPNLVAWILAGERRADDARMLELLEPYRGQRGRVQRLLEVAGKRPPRHGPRLAPRRFSRS